MEPLDRWSEKISTHLCIPGTNEMVDYRTFHGLPTTLRKRFTLCLKFDTQMNEYERRKSSIRRIEQKEIQGFHPRKWYTL